MWVQMVNFTLKSRMSVYFHCVYIRYRYSQWINLTFCCPWGFLHKPFSQDPKIPHNCGIVILSNYTDVFCFVFILFFKNWSLSPPQLWENIKHQAGKRHPLDPPPDSHQGPISSRALLELSGTPYKRPAPTLCNSQPHNTLSLRCGPQSTGCGVTVWNSPCTCWP